MLHQQQYSSGFLSPKLAWLFCLLAATLLAAINPNNTDAGIATYPLFLTTASKSNILVILDNSNSMDEAENGSAVGSNNPNSKSEIARNVIKNLITDYTGSINMGLMTYKQNALSDQYLYNSPYDVSYNPTNYESTFTGARESSTKRFRIENPASTGNYIYFNVNLPFYSTTLSSNDYCYSNTAQAFNNGEIPDTTPCNNGPWDTYRCYKQKTGTSDGLPNMSGSDAAAYGYSGNTYTSQFCTTDSDVAQGITDFGRFMTSHYVGRAWFASASPGRGYLHVPIKSLTAAQATSIKNKLACNIPGIPTPCTNDGIANAGLTPIEGTLLTAKDYFVGNWSTASEGYTASVYPLPESCHKNFAVLVTDGLPSTTKDGVAISNPATAITQAASAAGALLTKGIKTYVVGFALPYGTDPNTLNTIAASGGTTTAFFAHDSATLTAALETIFSIATQSGTAASIVTNSTRIDTDTLIYQAKFDSSDWTGKLIAYKVEADSSIHDPDADGNIEEDAAWNTDTPGKIPAHGSRNIYSIVGGTKSEFKWSELTGDQKTTLAGIGITENILNWLRGDHTNETTSGGLRAREKVLGDIVNSNPAYVGAANFGYEMLPSGIAGQDSYVSFRNGNKSRTKMLYVGANDGMLHAFNAETGVEKFAFIPPTLFSNLVSLSNPNYSHKYFVDGSPQSGDAYVNGGWKTIMVGTTGAGGKSVFALDVTSPDSFDQSKILWEFTDTDLGSPINQFIQPVIGRMNNGDWAVIFGNGYESSNHHAVLYVVNLSDGSLIKKIDTGIGGVSTPNGLAGPVLLPDDNRMIKYAYAGDRQGNFWKFDLSSTNKNYWDVAFKDGSTPKPLFQTIVSTGTTPGVPQPITAPPEIGKHPNGGYIVVFGTGKYFESGTTDTSIPPVQQSLYGIWDKDDGNASYIATDRSTAERSVALQEQEILAESVINGSNWRVVSKYPILWTGTDSKRGWYIDLTPPDSENQGERVVTVPLLRNGKAVFTTLIPIPSQTDPCAGGGTSWLMEVDMLSGGQFDTGVFDVNQDGKFTDADKITVSVDINGDGANETISHVSGIKSTVGIINTPSVISSGSIEYKYAGGSLGGIMKVTEKGDEDAGRQSWRQLR